MRRELHLWYEELERSPEDWSIRLRLMEAAVQAGKLAEAKRLVSTSPDDVLLPTELQQRIHRLLSHAVSEPPEAGGLPTAEE